MHVTDKQFQDEMCLWIKAVTGYTAIKAHANAPRPEGTYVVVNVLDEEEIGTEHTSLEDVDNTPDPPVSLKETIRGWVVKNVSVSVYRNNGTETVMDIARSIKLQLRSSDAAEYFSVRGIGYVRCNRTKEFEVVRENFTEKRANFDLVFNIYPEFSSYIDNVQGIAIAASSVVGDEEELISEQLTERS